MSNLPSWMLDVKARLDEAQKDHLPIYTAIGFDDIEYYHTALKTALEALEFLDCNTLSSLTDCSHIEDCVKCSAITAIHAIGEVK